MYDHYDALIFDMDGTIVDSGQLHEVAWISTFDAFGIPLDRPLMRSLAGVPTKRTLEIVLDHFDLPLHEHIDAMNAHKDRVVAEEMHKHVKPTALKAVMEAYQGKKPMAVGTGAQTHEAHTILEMCGLAHFFDAVVGADQVPHPKPAPDTFTRCAELLGVSSSSCVVFEDSALGLEAAASAGMAGVDVLKVHHIENDYFL
jgi:beta-phosphoglucomutase family hydrolase